MLLLLITGKVPQLVNLKMCHCYSQEGSVVTSALMQQSLKLEIIQTTSRLLYLCFLRIRRTVSGASEVGGAEG